MHMLLPHLLKILELVEGTSTLRKAGSPEKE
jgi:hypothetical protein